MKNYRSLQATSPLYEWLYYLKNLNATSINLGLERMQRVAECLELLNPAETIFTVAGTNGKGTTCRTLELMLLAAGLRVGVYSSPHLTCYTERVRIQGKELSAAEFSRSFYVIEKGRGKTLLTYFEFGTLSALYLFKQARLHVVILEVGLGGRLDATNIIKPSVAVITSIALEHTDWLGNDRNSIGSEKAGIFRCNTPAVIGEPDMPDSVQEVADLVGAKLYCNGTSWSYSVHSNFWQWKNNETLIDNLPLPDVPLANAATALAALNYSLLEIKQEAIYSGLQQARLPGRFEIVCKDPRLILDVAHNPHAACYLATCLENLPRNGGKVRAVVAMLLNKDIAATLECLNKQVDEWYCASLNESCGAKAEFLAQYLIKPRQFADVVSAWKQSMQDAKKQDIVIVCGSFYTVGQVMEALKKIQRV